MSAFWQWFFAIIGLVAFIMAAPFFLQLLFGQPKIGMVYLYDDAGKDGRVINVHFSNTPITNWLLKILRVTRLPIQDFFLLVKVCDALTGQVIIESFTPEIMLSPSSKDSRVSLNPSFLMANAKLVKWQRSTNSAVLLCGNKPISLREGTYIFNISIDLDGKIKICKPSLLHIGKIETEMVWDEKITGIFLT
jgi:hypothetical protein